MKTTKLFLWLEAIIACALVLFGHTAILNVFTWFQDPAPNVFFYLGFYILKCGITYIFQKNKRTEVILYGATLLAFPIPVLFQCFGPHDCLATILLQGLAWYVVPTLSFIYDLRSKPTVRMLVWRSVAEILIVRPIWHFIAAFVVAAIMTMLGVFPFGPG